MRHRRSSPPPLVRPTRLLARLAALPRAALRCRGVLPALLVALVVAGIGLLAPVLAAGRGGLTTAESAATSVAGRSYGEAGQRTGVVEMGVDGVPTAPRRTAGSGAPGRAWGSPSAGSSSAGSSSAGTASGSPSAGSAPAGSASAESSSAAGTSTAGPSAAGASADDPSSAGTSSAGTSSAGTSSAGTSAAGSSSAGSSSAGTSAGTSSAGASSAGSASPAPTPGTSSAQPAPGTSSAPSTTSRSVPATTAATPAGPEAAVLALVNQARAGAGCGALTADPALAAVARAHSADMRDRGYFSHTTPEGLSPFDRARAAGIGYARAENIASGQPDAAAVMEAWLNSAGHRANILDCSLTKLGVGVAEGPGGPWWTQLFGA